MKKIIITILALVVLSLALSAQVVFKDGNNTKSHSVYGYIYEWDGYNYVVDENASDVVHFSQTDSVEHLLNGSPLSYASQDYPTSGFYYFDIPYPHNMVTVSYVMVKYNDDYEIREWGQGDHIQIDIYLSNGNGPSPTPDNTIPAER